VQSTNNTWILAECNGTHKTEDSAILLIAKVYHGYHWNRLDMAMAATASATVSLVQSSEADSAGEMPPLVLAQAGLTVFCGMLLVIYLIGTLVNRQVLAQVLSMGVLMIVPLAFAPIVLGALIIRRSENPAAVPLISSGPKRACT
jgi:hypothetical protein